VLGETKILDPRREKWGADSENMKLLERYASPKTIARARRLAGTAGFPSAISRKVHGALLLRKEVDELKGNRALKAYSGARMAIRCADGNPRHLMKVFNALLMLRTRAQKREMGRGRRICWIGPAQQTHAMRILSANRLNRVRSYPDVGPELHAFLSMLGEYMRANLHERPLTTDQVTSVLIDDAISEREWELIEAAVGDGLLHPNVGLGNRDEMPWHEGTFHLAYALAPHFLLLPRRGKAASLAAMKEHWETAQQGASKFTNHRDGQLPLFGEGEDK